MRYLSYLAGLGLALSVNASVFAQSGTVDPFEIVSAETSHVETSKAKTRLHKANGGDKKISIYKSEGGFLVESMGTEERPDWMVVNLGPSRSNAAQSRYDTLETRFVTAYGSPDSRRGLTQSWDVPTLSPRPNQAAITTVMLYQNDNGDHMLKLDRRKGGVGSPVIARLVKKAPNVPAVSARAAPQAKLNLGWDGQPD